jgi:hypothetical protein
VQMAATGRTEPASLSGEEQTTLDDLHRRMKAGAQIVCVIRDCQNPQAKPEVLMLDGVSPGFLKQLAAEARPQDGLQKTSLEVPRARKVILEWDAKAGYVHQEPLPGAAQ